MGGARGHAQTDLELSHAEVCAALGVGPHQVELPVLAPGLVHRPRVVGALQALATPVVAVVAGAGYGKTTVARQLLEVDGRLPVWARFHRHDDDPVALARIIAAAFLRVAPDRALFDAVREPQPRVDRVVASLGALARSLPPFLMVVDDADAIVDPEAQAMADAFLDLVPAGSQVVLVGRSVPGGRLARRLAAGAASEVTASLLSFTPSETGELLAGRAAGADPELAGRLAARALGWPVGLQFAAMALEAGGGEAAVSAISADGAHLVRFVHEELLGDLAPDRRRFLVRAAVVPQMTGEILDAVLQCTASGPELEALERDGRVVLAPEPESAGWRFHPVFRSILLADLRTGDAAEHDRLHRRAIDWHLAHGNGKQAVAQAMELGDRAFVAEVVFGQLAVTLLRGEVATVVRWLDWFRPDELRTDPLLALSAGWVALMEDRGDDLGRWLDLASSMQRPGPCPDGTESFELGCSVLRMVSGFGGVRETIRHADAVLAAGAGAGPWAAPAAHLAAICRFVAGDVPDAREAFAEAEFAIRPWPSMHVLTVTQLGLDAIRRGDRRDGLRLLAGAAREMADAAILDYPIVAPAVAAQAYAHALRGDVARHRAEERRAVELLAQFRTVMHRGNVSARVVLAEAALAVQDVDGAARHLADAAHHLAFEPEAALLHRWADELHRRIAAHRSTPGAGELTPAELRVLEQLASHRSLSEIGDHLYVSRNTVKSHTLSIYRKLDVAGRSQAVEVATRLGLLDGDTGSAGGPPAPVSAAR